MDLTLAQRVLETKKEYVCRIDFDRFLIRKLKHPSDMEVFKDNLLVVKDVMGEFNIPFFLMFGTLLGAVRDKEFIKHDKDIDLGFFREDKTDFYKVILELKKYDFRLLRTDHTDNLISVIRDDEYIDFCFFDPINLPVRSLVEYPFLDTTFLIPENYDDILTTLYGDWHVIDKEKTPNTIFKLDR